MGKSILGGWLTVCLFVAPVTVVADTSEEPAHAAKPGSAKWAHIEITGQYPEGPQSPGLFGKITEGLSDGIGRLRKAAEDEAIDGILIRIDDPQLGWGKQYEFRQAVRRVQQQGKRVYAWLDDASSKEFLLATACDHIVMPESGSLMLLGLRAEVTFYKNLFDKLGIEADMLQVGKYKSAGEPYTRTEMSPAFRKEMETLLDDYFHQMVTQIAEGRGLEREDVIAAINNGPHTARAAQKRGLIDQVAYDDELKTLLSRASAVTEVKFARDYGKKKVDRDFTGFTGLMKLMNLMMGVQPDGSSSSQAKIAVIYANGLITTGRSQSGGLGGDLLGSETTIKAIRRAKDDEDVKALVLRVNSPGGSALASDLIWHALETVEKPVVVSMGDVAASGGYYIAMGAEAVFATPGTLTGSIGVVGGKFGLKGLFNKIGVTTSVISRGENSGLRSVLNGFTQNERQAMLKMLKTVYGQFTRKAADGRDMKLDKLEKLARGRVYTGTMARQNGLVDRLGTLEDAVRHAQKLAGLDPDKDVSRLELPRPVSPFEQLFGPIDSKSGVSSTTSGKAVKNLLGSLAPELARQLQAAAMVKLLARHPRLTLMPYHLLVR